MHTLILIVLVLIVGISIGYVIAKIKYTSDTGRGYYTLKPVEDEDGFYAINVRILPNQRLDKKRYILLTRE